MLNQNLLCEIEKIKTTSKLILKQEPNYKVLKVIEIDKVLVGGDVKPEDTIYVSIGSGFDIKVNGKDYVVINIKEVILVL